ncbi:MAG TPA: hypothetical protein VIV35_06560 [Chitinophagaceae bacterium]
MNSIEMRLQKLEATNRRYKAILILMIASFATIFMAFRSPRSVPDVIQAKKFEVVDDYGNVLVNLTQDDGKGLIKTYNKEGKKLVNITYTTNQEGYIALEDGNGQETIRLSSSNEGGGGYFSIFNPSGKRTLTLCNDNSGGNIYVSNSNGDSRAAIQCNSSAGGFLGLYNSSGYTAVKLTQTSSGNGDLYINNYNGDERVRLSVSAAAGNFQLKNNSKTMIVEMGGTNGENGTINTYNSSGTFVQGIGSSY